jgi:hypothetical protein
MNHFHDDPLNHDPEHPGPGPGEWSLDASSLNANAAHRQPPTPLGDLAQVMIVGRDGPWALVFVPLNRDLVWVDLERTPFCLQDYDPLASESSEDSPASSADEWDPEGDWPLY